MGSRSGPPAPPPYGVGQPRTEDIDEPVPFHATKDDPAAYQGGYHPGGHKGKWTNDFGDWFNSALQVVVSNFGSLLAMTLLGLASLFAGLALVFFAAGYGEVLADPTVLDNPFWAPEPNWFVVSLALVALVAAAGIFTALWLGQMCVLHRGHDVQRGLPVPKLGLAAATRMGFNHLPRYMGWTLAQIGVLLLLGVMASPLIDVLEGGLTEDVKALAGVLLLVAIPLIIWLAVRLSMVYPAIALGPRRLNPFSESFRVTKGRVLTILGRILVLVLGTRVVSEIVFAIGVSMTGSDGAAPVGGEAVVAMLNSVAIWTLLQFAFDTLLNLVVISGLVGMYGDAGGQVHDRISAKYY